MKITLAGISKSFEKGKPVLTDLSVSFASGALTSLLGFSGCGKTTLLRIIAGLEKPDKGEIFFDEECVFSQEKNINLSPIERGVGMVFQDFALFPNMTVFKNVSFSVANTLTHEEKKSFPSLKERRKEILSRSLEALRMVKMETYKDRLPSELSGGQKQRVAIARAIAVRPRILLFDEPLSALDALLREKMQGEIRALVSKIKTTSIFVTHDQKEAMSISDQIYLMNKGRIVEKGTPDEIYKAPKTRFAADFIGKVSWLDKTHYLRPEDIEIALVGNSARVISRTYEGREYLVESVDSENRHFLCYTAKKPEINAPIHLSYLPSKVRSIQKED